MEIDVRKEYPFVKCLHPKHITTRDGRPMVVPCGHCKICALQKSSFRSFLCSLEEQDNRFALFVTLTYAPEYLPIVQPILVKNESNANCGFLLKNCTPRLEKEGAYLGFDEAKRHKSGIKYMKALQNKVNLGGNLPYVSKLDLQRFLKRFRKHLSKHTDEKIRYYAVGEYGPVHFRPHYHIILYFNKQKTLSVYKDCLRKAWKFGRIDASLSRHGVSSYVAGYVNSSVSLPQTFKLSALQPFSLHSIRFGQGFYQSKREEIYTDAVNGIVSRSREVCGSVVEHKPWRSLALAFFPKCRNYADKSFGELLQSYSILRTAKNIYGNDCTVNYLAHAIYSDVRDNECTRYFAYAFDYKDKSRRVDITNVRNFHDNTPYPIITESESVITGYEQAISAISSELYISKHFLEKVCDHDSFFEHQSKVRQIQNFYNVLDEQSLHDFYEFQQKYITDDNLRDALLFYDNVYTYESGWKRNSPAVKQWLHNLLFGDVGCITYVDDDDNIQNNKLYKIFVSYMNERFNRSIKHKKLNDLNKIFINV